MNDLQTLLTEFNSNVKDIIEKESKILDDKRQLVASEKRDKLLIDQQQTQLDGIRQDLERRESELEKNIQLNRERTKMLELKEEKINQEKERLRGIMVSLNLDEN